MDTIDSTICPFCGSQETYTNYSSLEDCCESLTCETCKKEYMIHYEVRPVFSYAGNRKNLKAISDWKKSVKKRTH